MISPRQPLPPDGTVTELRLAMYGLVDLGVAHRARELKIDDRETRTRERQHRSHKIAVPRRFPPNKKLWADGVGCRHVLLTGSAARFGDPGPNGTTAFFGSYAIF